MPAVIDHLTHPFSTLVDDWSQFGILGRVLFIALMPVALVVGFALGALACLLAAAYVGV